MGSSFLFPRSRAHFPVNPWKEGREKQAGLIHADCTAKTHRRGAESAEFYWYILCVLCVSAVK